MAARQTPQSDCGPSPRCAFCALLEIDVPFDSQKQHAVAHMRSEFEYEQDQGQFNKLYALCFPSKTHREKNKEEHPPSPAQTRASRKRRRTEANICSKCNISVSDINEHLSEKHLQEDTLACSACDYSNKWQWPDIMEHIRLKHQGKAAIIDERYKYKLKFNSMKRRYFK